MRGYNPKFCQSTTAKGFQCSNRIAYDGLWCKVHWKRLNG